MEIGLIGKQNNIDLKMDGFTAYLRMIRESLKRLSPPPELEEKRPFDTKKRRGVIIVRGIVAKEIENRNANMQNL